MANATQLGPTWRAGERVSARKLNWMIDLTRAAGPIYGEGVEVFPGPRGVGLNVPKARRLRPDITPIILDGIAGTGVYHGVICNWKKTINFDPTAAFNLDDWVDHTFDRPAWIANSAESQVSTNRVPRGVVIPAFLTFVKPDVNGLPLYLITYQHAVRFIKFDITTGVLSMTFHDGATADDIDDQFWIPIMTFQTCDNSTGAAAMTASKTASLALAYTMALI